MPPLAALIMCVVFVTVLLFIERKRGYFSKVSYSHYFSIPLIFQEVSEIKSFK